MDLTIAVVLLMIGLFAAVGTPLCVHLYFNSLAYSEKNESARQKAMRTSWIVAAVGILLCLPFLFGAYDNDLSGGYSSGSSGGSSVSTNTCSWCGKSYKAGDSSGNYISIARTKFCKSCYAFYDSASNVLGK